MTRTSVTVGEKTASVLVAAAKAAQIRQMSVTEKNVTGAQMEIVRVIGS